MDHGSAACPKLINIPLQKRTPGTLAKKVVKFNFKTSTSIHLVILHVVTRKTQIFMQK